MPRPAGRQEVDLAAFDLREMAADAEDLRNALGIGRWNVMALGTTSRIALEYPRQDPGPIRAVVLDSPTGQGRTRSSRASRRPGMRSPSCWRRVPPPVRGCEGQVQEDRPVRGRPARPLRRAGAGGRLDASYEIVDADTFTASDAGQNIEGTYTFDYRITGDRLTVNMVGPAARDPFFVVAWQAAPFYRTS